jgi:PAS domain S-box-containing protein
MGVMDIGSRPLALDPIQRERQQLYRFVEQAPLGIAMLDSDLKYLAYSRRWLIEFGNGRETLVGLAHYEAHPDLKEEWKAAHRRALAGETVRNDEDYWQDADGSENWARWVVLPWHDEAGRIGGIIISVENITGRKRVEGALAENQARLAGIIDSATDAIVSVDEQMRITLFNPAAQRIFGYDAQEIQGQSIDRLIPHGVRHAHRRHIERFAREGTTSRSMTAPGELRALRSDGSEIVIEASISKAVVGNRQFFTAIVRDVTERNRLQAEIVLSEQRMELALEGANLGMWDLDIAKARFTSSPRLIGMLGYVPGEIEPNDKTFIAHLHPDDAPRFAAAFYDHLKGKTPRLAVEYRMRHKDGKWVWIISRGMVVERDATGRAIRMTGTNLDITERRVAQDNERRLARAFKLLSKCASLLVHAEEERKLLAAICKLSVEIGNYAMAWVGFAEHDADKTVRPVAQFADHDGYLATAGITWDESVRGQGPVGTAIRTGRAVVVQDLSTSANMILWREAARARGYRACIALPLVVNEVVLGTLTIYSLESSIFGRDEVQLLKQLANDLAYGIQTLRSRAEHEESRLFLKRESEKNRALLRNASDGIHIVDMAGTLVEASDSFCEMLGYTRDEIIGMNVARWDAGFAGAERNLVLGRKFLHQGRSQFESVHRRKDGTMFDVEVSCHPIELDGGALLFNSSRDITERKRAQDSLREGEQRLRAIIDQSPIGIAFGRDGVTVDVNAAYLQMFGYASVDEVRGKSLIEQIAPQCRAEIEDRIRRRREGEPVESGYETTGLRRDLSQFPMFVSAKRLQLHEGPLTFAFLIDITQELSSVYEVKRL